jgi:hypothetical protein
MVGQIRSCYDNLGQGSSVYAMLAPYLGLDRDRPCAIKLGLLRNLKPS